MMIVIPKMIKKKALLKEYGSCDFKIEAGCMYPPNSLNQRTILVLDAFWMHSGCKKKTPSEVKIMKIILTASFYHWIERIE